MKKVLLDTDIGTDIDDALCLAYLLARQDCELMGITTVSGEAEKRAMMASAICKQANKDIPIFPGAKEPLIITQHQPHAQQACKLSNWEHDTSFESGYAVEFMRKTIRENPGEVSLLAVGPLTNIAALFKADEEIPSLLKELVLMCGYFPRPELTRPEWNAACDPHAAAIVYGAKVNRHISVGLDVTEKLVLHKDKLNRHKENHLLKPVLDFAEVWFENAETTTFHDPLAAAVIFDDGICEFENGNISIDLSSERLKGAAYFDRAVGGAHSVAMNVDVDRFFEHYFAAF